MSIVVITGTHPRHSFVANALIQTNAVVGCVFLRREDFFPDPPKSLDPELAQLFAVHFEGRQTSEMAFFGEQKQPQDLPSITIERSSFETAATIEFIKSLNPRLVISYGCKKISSKMMAEIGCKFWNIHGGISPDYRGVTTHFWPSYFLEPQMTGMTLHETTSALDGGGIVFQTSARLTRGDGIHDLACRTVSDFASSLTKKFSVVDFDRLPEGKTQSGYGKVFRHLDWRPEHLRLIYLQYDNRIVDAVLDGEIEGREPELIDLL